MATEVKVPTLGESVTEATVGQWLKKPGEAVAADEPIVSLETDKVAVDVPAPAAGTMGDIVAKEGDTVEVGALLGYVNEGAAAAASPAPAPAAAPAKAEAAAPAPTSYSFGLGHLTGSGAVYGADGRRKVPKFWEEYGTQATILNPGLKDKMGNTAVDYMFRLRTYEDRGK